MFIQNTHIRQSNVSDVLCRSFTLSLAVSNFIPIRHSKTQCKGSTQHIGHIWLPYVCVLYKYFSMYLLESWVIYTKCISFIQTFDENL